MAIEDGAALGILLGALSRSNTNSIPNSISASIPTSIPNSTSTSPSPLRTIPSILHLYESLRKPRATTNVLGARANQSLWHMRAGRERDERDAALRTIDIEDPQSRSEWSFVDRRYQSELMGADVVGETRRGFEEWMMNCGG